MRKEPCPVCGQSGLCDALLENLAELRVVVCQECEALWVGEEIESFSGFTIYEEFMAKRSAEPDWSKIQILS